MFELIKSDIEILFKAKWLPLDWKNQFRSALGLIGLGVLIVLISALTSMIFPKSTLVVDRNLIFTSADRFHYLGMAGFLIVIITIPVISIAGMLKAFKPLERWLIRVSSAFLEITAGLGLFTLGAFGAQFFRLALFHSPQSKTELTQAFLYVILVFTVGLLFAATKLLAMCISYNFSNNLNLIRKRTQILIFLISLTIWVVADLSG